MFASPICGALAAAYLTLPTVDYLRSAGIPMPGDDAQTVLASAFLIGTCLIGTCAMWISDLIFEIIVRRFNPKEPSA